jgi:CheY-like chemotaxis protein
MSKRILIIDDEPYVREIIQVSLETFTGWQILTAGSGHEGIATAEVEFVDATHGRDHHVPKTTRKLQDATSACDFADHKTSDERSPPLRRVRHQGCDR